MSETTGQGPDQRSVPGSVGRSILAVVAGFIFVVVVSIGTDMALHLAGVFPKLGEGMSDSLFALATAYRTVYGIIGSYITARLAPNQPMRLALIGGAIGLVIATIGAVLTWNKGPAFGPHWYPISLIVGALPTAWLGGKIRLMQMSSR